MIFDLNLFQKPNHQLIYLFFRVQYPNNKAVSVETALLFIMKVIMQKRIYPDAAFRL